MYLEAERFENRCIQIRSTVFDMYGVAWCLTYVLSLVRLFVV